jgi:hypothetical protein
MLTGCKEHFLDLWRNNNTIIPCSGFKAFLLRNKKEANGKKFQKVFP